MLTYETHATTLAITSILLHYGGWQQTKGGDDMFGVQFLVLFAILSAMIASIFSIFFVGKIGGSRDQILTKSEMRYILIFYIVLSLVLGFFVALILELIGNALFMTFG